MFHCHVSLLEGTERPRIQRHIYIPGSIFLLKAQKIAIPLMYIPFLVCCSLHLRWVRYVMMPVNVADRGVWNELLSSLFQGFSNSSCIFSKASSSVVWVVCDMNAPWHWPGRRLRDWDLWGPLLLCLALGLILSWQAWCINVLVCFLSKLTVVLVGLKVWSSSSTLSLGVLDHCCWRPWPNKWTTTVPGLPCLPGATRLLIQRRCGRQRRFSVGA